MMQKLIFFVLLFKLPQLFQANSLENVRRPPLHQQCDEGERSAAPRADQVAPHATINRHYPWCLVRKRNRTTTWQHVGQSDLAHRLFAASGRLVLHSYHPAQVRWRDKAVQDLPAEHNGGHSAAAWAHASLGQRSALHHPERHDCLEQLPSRDRAYQGH